MLKKETAVILYATGDSAGTHNTWILDRPGSVIRKRLFWSFIPLEMREGSLILECNCFEMLFIMINYKLVIYMNDAMSNLFMNTVAMSMHKSISSMLFLRKWGIIIM